jgi:hypothetical protein
MMQLVVSMFVQNIFYKNHILRYSLGTAGTVAVWKKKAGIAVISIGAALAILAAFLMFRLPARGGEDRSSKTIEPPLTIWSGPHLEDGCKRLPFSSPHFAFPGFFTNDNGFR